MITGEIKSKIDQIWNSFWSGGISNPLEVMEQMTYLLFIRRLDEIQITKEKKANRLKTAVENPIFTPEQDHLRWSKFITLGDPTQLYDTIANEVFPFIKSIGSEDDTTYSHHMKDARFTIPTPALLTKVVDILAEVPMDDKDTKGDIYEYMLGKIASAGQNGQFRTPRHIIKMIVELMQPKPTDTICDPACGTAGFLVAASEYLNEHHSTEIFASPESAKRFSEETFFGYDFDSTMLRIGSMNMMLHGVENPSIEYRDSLSEEHSHIESQFSLILANPPFKGSLDESTCAKNIQTIVKTKKTELLFLALFLRILKTGGRAAVIIPDGVLFGSSTAHKTLRKKIVEEQKLEAIISMPSGVFKPYAGVSTAIMIFTKTETGGTDKVWFYDMQADGYSLDDKRNELDSSKYENNNIPDIIARFKNLEGEANRKATEQSFLVDKADIAANGYDLSINRYKEVVYEQVEYETPSKILSDLELLEQDILEGMKELKELLK
ncbi:eco57I restriction-modification methylase family protein [Acinetobacter sp. 1294596]|uniref:type I restriction-modification system subunit M n=1 Tax=Acinetobacter sp. 1294596 TaxID=1310603 RepID=UPI00044BCF1E|nr:class I SAM-dependent DNA methyltransferase [Acinetobacter sp. 1294596]EXF58010.1 eco57I restriction-modification methylase family protein [Acinetobacter sp. 1294596]